MYSIYLFGRIALYSSKELAQRNACRFLMNHCIKVNSYSIKNSCNQAVIPSFIEAYQREDYEAAIDVWNKLIVPNAYYGNSLYCAQILKTEIDKDFT